MNEPAVLLVEDNSNDELLAVRALRKSGVTNPIVVVRDGQEALDYLFGEGAWAGRDVMALPRVLLLDLKLPKVSGLEVLGRIRDDERFCSLPVVIFTSSAMSRDVDDAYRLGTSAYVQKPVATDRFEEAMQRLGRFWVQVNRVPPRC